MDDNTGKKPKGRQGFASMSPEKRREIASKGGKSVPAEKRAFSQDRALASRSGHVGGLNVSNESRSFSKDRDLAQRAGAIGGASRRRSCAVEG